MGKRLNFGPYSFEVTNLDKVLFPLSGITKGDLIAYYGRIAPTMLPHLRERPLMMQRFPDGIGEEGFYQKDVTSNFPDWIERCEVRTVQGKRVTHVVCDKAATLVYLAQEATITPHIWLSRVDGLHYPDKLIFDLDPPDGDFDIVRKTAFIVKEYFERLGLVPFVMTTGSRGLHVVAPLNGDANFDQARAFARKLAEEMVKEHPEELTVKQHKAGRGKRLYLDINRNAYGQTGVSPYAFRARPGAPVATPLSWGELKRKDLGPRSYTIANIFRRLGRKADPFKDIYGHSRSLHDAMSAIEKSGRP
ncbi:MAG: non-homologous end-joining DNA ligase [Actinomycetota bacterium]|nr:non-homologous end-joining DNA ligase [Actinomycetota bacterium]